MRVIDNLHRQEGFKVEDGWVLLTFEQYLKTAVDSEGNMVEELHKVKYLFHTEKGHVVTSQHKAWNDQVRFAMYGKLVVSPWRQKIITSLVEQHSRHTSNTSPLLLWMDNCTIHTTETILNYF